MCQIGFLRKFCTMSLGFQWKKSWAILELHYWKLLKLGFCFLPWGASEECKRCFKIIWSLGSPFLKRKSRKNLSIILKTHFEKSKNSSWVTKTLFLPKCDVLQGSVLEVKVGPCTKEHATFRILKIRPRMTELWVVKYPKIKLNFFPGKLAFREVIFISFILSSKGL